MEGAIGERVAPKVLQGGGRNREWFPPGMCVADLHRDARYDVCVPTLFRGTLVLWYFGSLTIPRPRLAWPFVCQGHSMVHTIGAPVPEVLRKGRRRIRRNRPFFLSSFLVLIGTWIAA